MWLLIRSGFKNPDQWYNRIWEKEEEDETRRQKVENQVQGEQNEEVPGQAIEVQLIQEEAGEG